MALFIFSAPDWRNKIINSLNNEFKNAEIMEFAKNEVYDDEIDILLHQSGAEKINKAIKNIIWLILSYIFIKNGQQWQKMTKKGQKNAIKIMKLLVSDSQETFDLHGCPWMYEDPRGYPWTRGSMKAWNH